MFFLQYLNQSLNNYLTFYYSRFNKKNFNYNLCLEKIKKLSIYLRQLDLCITDEELISYYTIYKNKDLISYA